MRDLSPGPLLIRYAVVALSARTPRKSRLSAPGTLPDCQVAPPSRVHNQTPPAPLAQATFALTALIPRREAVVPLVWSTQVWAKAAVAMRRYAARAVIVFRVY